jgi:hypothetical protein
MRPRIALLSGQAQQDLLMLSRILNDEVSDTTDDDSSNTACSIIPISTYRLYQDHISSQCL